MPTENDTLLRVCAKHSSGKEYCRQLAQYLEDNVLDKLESGIRQFE